MMAAFHKYLYFNQTSKYYRMYYCPQHDNADIYNVSVNILESLPASRRLITKCKFERNLFK